MLSDFDSSLRAVAEVIVRVGVNLQPGQPLLLTEPYELHGIHPETGPLVEALRSVASTLEAGNPPPAVEVIPANLPRLRRLAETDDRREFEVLVRGHIRRLERHLARGGAFLFLLGSQPQLLAGLPAERLAAFDRIKWRHLGPLIQRLVRGASQWTLVPAPSGAWAEAAFADLSPADRLPSLWGTVFQAMRVPSAAGGTLGPDRLPAESRHQPAPTLEPIAAWRSNLATLAGHRDDLNTARHRRIRFRGPGTDLLLDLPRSHVWCTAQLKSQAGVPFVANLPTEEIFTAPHQGSAAGTVRVARPVVHGGARIEGIELAFHAGRVVEARARTGQEALQHLLATDDGACRLGEVALVPALRKGRSPTGRFFHHTLLDENAAHHIALGEAYPFSSSAWVPLALNRSQVHVDLPLDAEVELA